MTGQRGGRAPVTAVAMGEYVDRLSKGANHHEAALAAGHRPCAECQRERFTQFRDLWATANPELAGTPRPYATVLDLALHQERIASINHRNGSSISI